MVGPDGSGKSTIASRLVAAMASQGNRVEHRHWAPGHLPRPGALMGRPRRPTDRPHRAEPHSRPVSALLVSWFFVDFVLGDLVDGRRGARSSEIRTLVQERGWWDLQIDPRRYRLRPSDRLVRALGRLLRPPDLVVVLAVDPESAADRSGELSGEEIDRQVRHWDGMAGALGPVLRVETGPTEPEPTVTRILDVLTDAEQQGIWRSVPSRRRSRLMFRTPGPPPSAAVQLLDPISRPARIAAGALRLGLSSPLRRWAPRAIPPPVELERAARDERATGMVGRRFADGRVVVASSDGERLVRVAKSDRANEARSIRRAEALLDGSAVRPPTLIEVARAESGVVCLRAERHRPPEDPSLLPAPVARALGVMWRSSRSRFAHGDAAPWNLLHTASGPVLIDWEHAFDGAPAFYDVWHWMVQAHLLIGGPHPAALRDVDRAALRAYATGARLDGDPQAFLAPYLIESEQRFPVDDPLVSARRGELRRTVG